MEIGIENLTFMKELILFWQGFLHFHNHFGIIIYLSRLVHNGGACRPILLVRDSTVQSGPLLKDDFVVLTDQCFDACRNNPHSVFFFL